MPPPKKRVAEPEWTHGDRVRRALIRASVALTALHAELAALPADAPRVEIDVAVLESLDNNAAVMQAHADRLAPQLTPVLPTDCWRIIMEFVLDRRTMASFGTGGQINEPHTWFRAQSSERTEMLHTLRLVTRNWCGAASQLVRTIHIAVRKVADCSVTTRVFPRATFMTDRCAKSGHAHHLCLLPKYVRDSAGRVHSRSIGTKNFNDLEPALLSATVIHWALPKLARVSGVPTNPHKDRARQFMLNYSAFRMLRCYYFAQITPADRGAYTIVVVCNGEEAKIVFKVARALGGFRLFVATNAPTPLPVPPNVTVVPNTLQFNNGLWVPQ